jgi:hypothetical protein
VNSIYFRITEPTNPVVFDDVWWEIPATQNKFFLGRSLWRAHHVSRSSSQCAVLYFDLDYQWEMKNLAPGRVVILNNGNNRFELLTRMSTEIGPGTWTGTLTEAFNFEISHLRPNGSVRRYQEPDPSVCVPDDIITQPRNMAVRARAYLEKHRIKRLALAYMWRQHLEHTPDLAEDLDSATVGLAFRETPKTITGWREDLAAHVFTERRHQNAIREWVIKHRVMTRKDVIEADGWVQEHGRPPGVPPNRGQQQQQQRSGSGADLSTTRRPPRPRG